MLNHAECRPPLLCGFVSTAAVYFPQSEGLVATELSRGPWDPGAQHGGAPAAILMRAFEGLPAGEGLLISRVTYELLRPVPLGELLVDAEVIRGGRRVQLLEGAIRTPDGIEIVRARALQVHQGDPSARTSPPTPSPPGPDQGREHESGAEGFNPPYRPMFAPDAIEIRFVDGLFGNGPSTAWFRLRVPLVAGEEPTPLQRLAAAGDFGNGISAELSWDEYAFINPDLTLYMERPPEGEWICLQSRTTIADGGVGLAESVIYDLRGRVGRAVQALLVARR
jgi:Acyl-CoA thioesterase C-terminal domain/Acyl-CoA thioesterase N-terminal domain